MLRRNPNFLILLSDALERSFCGARVIITWSTDSINSLTAALTNSASAISASIRSHRPGRPCYTFENRCLLSSGVGLRLGPIVDGISRLGSGCSAKSGLAHNRSKIKIRSNHINHMSEKSPSRTCAHRIVPVSRATLPLPPSILASAEFMEVWPTTQAEQCRRIKS